MPKYYFAKDKVTFDASKMDAVMSSVLGIFPGYALDTRDGVKATGDKHWIHIRKSGTEPIIRIYVESDSAERSRRLCDEAIAKLNTAANN